MSSPLIPYLVRHYAETKRQHPAEGRRKWRLRVVQQLLTAVGSGGSIDSEHDLSTSDAEFDKDPDPFDGVTRDVPELGLIVRTDFSDEAAWSAFCTRLQDSEKELVSVVGSDDTDENAPSEQSPHPDNTAPGDSQEDDSDDEEGDGPQGIFYIINPSAPQERELLENISNLMVLRLFNDVDVRPSPTPPRGTKRIDPPNRLVDYHGLQEIYQGKNLWAYDATSNMDQCVRVVSHCGDMYGTATGDSWRARVSHICELQVNLSSGALKIDFGGLDRWDFNERRRNMLEAER